MPSYSADLLAKFANGSRSAMVNVVRRAKTPQAALLLARSRARNLFHDCPVELTVVVRRGTKTTVLIRPIPPPATYLTFLEVRFEGVALPTQIFVGRQPTPAGRVRAAARGLRREWLERGRDPIEARVVVRRPPPVDQAAAISDATTHSPHLKARDAGEELDSRPLRVPDGRLADRREERGLL